MELVCATTSSLCSKASSVVSSFVTLFVLCTTRGGMIKFIWEHNNLSDVGRGYRSQLYRSQMENQFSRQTCLFFGKWSIYRKPKVHICSNNMFYETPHTIIPEYHAIMKNACKALAIYQSRFRPSTICRLVLCKTQHDSVADRWGQTGRGRWGRERQHSKLWDEKREDNVNWKSECYTPLKCFMRWHTNRSGILNNGHVLWLPKHTIRW